MIRDFAQRDGKTDYAADVCIVGAGAAGIAIAREFVGTPYRILLLEAGGMASERDTQKLYEGEVVGRRHVGLLEGRERVFGGTTTVWGGQAIRLDEFDLGPRSWVPYSGWPVSKEELEPYYERAARVLRLGPALSYQDLCTAFRIQPPAFDPSRLRMECTQWSPAPNFAKTYGAELRSAPGICVLLHANVTSIVTNETATAVDRVEFKTLAGKEGAARARHYVVCCGGIETARLLLASDSVQPHGLANDHDLVGRFFQDHIHFGFGGLPRADRRRLENWFESFYVRGLKYYPVISLGCQKQREEGLLSIHGSVGFGDAPGSPVHALKRLFAIAFRGSRPRPGEVRYLLGLGLSRPGDALRLLYRLYIGKRAGTSGRGPIGLGAQAEHAPNPDSRVTLGEERDRLGMRKVRLDWRLGELERRTLQGYLKTIGGEFARLGLSSVDPKWAAAFDQPDQWLAGVHDSAHHMGTARMHESPRRGVVDPHCRVHGVVNLYLGSSAVFPTSGRSNPTLTIIALCLRIADRLKLLLEDPAAGVRPGAGPPR
jgi:choline dehydrogenase-like flavoprotein